MAAYKTAIKRNRLSAPVKALNDAGRLTGRLLDYGCGRGGDAERLGCDGYDPHFRPELPDNRYDTIICNYVLNVIENPQEREEVLANIAAYLKHDGVAYITVRADKKALTGYTKNGTWQGYIELNLPVVQRGSGYVTYAMRQHEWNCEIISTTFDKPAA